MFITFIIQLIPQSGKDSNQPIAAPSYIHRKIKSQCAPGHISNLLGILAASDSPDFTQSQSPKQESMPILSL
jgi:hypothetical protein